MWKASRCRSPIGKTGTEQQTLGQIRQLYAQYHPGFPLEYTFLNETFQAQYAAEKRISVLSRYFGRLAILISCLGLFGLPAFTAERRSREMGIRKVLGATAGNVIMLLPRDFLKLIGVSISVAFPLAWWAVSRWLAGSAYRIVVGAEPFVTAGSLIGGVAACAVNDKFFAAPFGPVTLS